MDKIRDLINKLGGSPELSDKIMESLAEYKAEVEQGVGKEFKRRLEEAKKICVEEVEKEKTDLRRKTEIFLESRANTIDREAKRQAAIGETEATRKLRGVKSLIEGIQIGETSSENQAPIVAENKKLRLKVNQLAEDVSRLTAKAERANTIATKVLQRNKILESKTVRTVNESKEQTLNSLRRPGTQPSSTRPVLAESQQRNKFQESQRGDPVVVGIANQLDGMPAFLGSNQ